MKAPIEYIDELIMSGRFDNDTFLIAIPGSSSREFARNTKRAFLAPGYVLRTENRGEGYPKEDSSFYLDLCTRDKRVYSHISRNGNMFSTYEDMQRKFGVLPTASGAIHAREINRDEYVTRVSELITRLVDLNFGFIMHHDATDKIAQNGCLYLPKPLV